MSGSRSPRFRSPRVSTNDQDLTAQKNTLVALGLTLDKAFTDPGLTGANRARPRLREALAACRAGDTLVVTKLDRLARSLRDAKDIVDELTRREVKLSIGGSIHDRTDPVGRLLFNVLAMVAERFVIPADVPYKSPRNLHEFSRIPDAGPERNTMISRFHREEGKRWPMITRAQ
ncbi:recombinase family protein [Cryobacterium fucosi]|uniref:Recombinase family protein n=1 Tax=Cryobacterium fucosi TaxID=1259157 RepID=A0A4R9B917_9MICO|nr:recombinase family protein [Cryobacterium fucosi]